MIERDRGDRAIVSGCRCSVEVLLELREIDQRLRVDREARLLESANANRELVRNLMVRDLKVRSIRLVTSHARQYVGLQGFGIDITGQIVPE